MKEYAKQFYKSKAWQRCRESYLKKVGYLCERCLKKGLYVPAEIVHHKVYLDESNILDESFTLNFANLEALCRDCHAEEHDDQIRKAKGLSDKRYTVDELGRVKITGK